MTPFTGEHDDMTAEHDDMDPTNAADLQRHDDMTREEHHVMSAMSAMSEAVFVCKTCGADIRTEVRRNTVRCPACRTPNYIPKSPGPGPTLAAADAAEGIGGSVGVVSVWAPEPLPVELEPSEEECPDCDGPLVWEPAGTLLYCDACEEPVFPAGLEPRPAAAGDVRRVPTQAERDDAALELAERRAVILDAVGRVLRREDLHPKSRGRLEWYASEIGRAATMARLAELAERLQRERIRRDRWWRADADNPAELLDGPGDEEDPAYDEYDGDDYDGADEGQDDAGGRALPAVAAGPPPLARMQTREDFAARGYRIDPEVPPNHCQVMARTTYSADPVFYACGAAGRCVYAGVRVCQGHYDALSAPLDWR